MNSMGLFLRCHREVAGSKDLLLDGKVNSRFFAALRMTGLLVGSRESSE
jgi:hypothetical protein